jgi:hypothetical protein
MVEYKKKKIVLQSGGKRNFYYKITADGKKKQVSKSEYLEKKGGSGLSISNNIEKTIIKLEDIYTQLENGNEHKNIIAGQISELLKEELEKVKRIIPNTQKEWLNQSNKIEEISRKLLKYLSLNDIQPYTEDYDIFMAGYNSRTQNEKMIQTHRRLTDLKKNINKKKEQEKINRLPSIITQLNEKIKNYLDYLQTLSKNNSNNKLLTPDFITIKEILNQLLVTEPDFYKDWNLKYAFERIKTANKKVFNDADVKIFLAIIQR